MKIASRNSTVKASCPEEIEQDVINEQGSGTEECAFVVEGMAGYKAHLLFAAIYSHDLKDYVSFDGFGITSVYFAIGVKVRAVLLYIFVVLHKEDCLTDEAENIRYWPMDCSGSSRRNTNDGQHKQKYSVCRLIIHYSHLRPGIKESQQSNASCVQQRCNRGNLLQLADASVSNSAALPLHAAHFSLHSCPQRRISLGRRIPSGKVIRIWCQMIFLRDPRISAT